MSRNIATVAVGLAILFEICVFGEAPGIGFLLFWFTTLLGTGVLLYSGERQPLSRVWMFLPSLLISFALFRYDGEVLKTWGAFCAVLFLFWAVAWNLVQQWNLSALSRLLPQHTFHATEIGRQARNSLKVESKWDKEQTQQVARGVTLALVLLLVFGTLLASADAVFDSKLGALAQLFEGVSPGPLARTGLWVVLLAGLLRIWIHTKESPTKETRSFFSPTELLISLGSLNLLLVSFLLLQVRYLFGDSTAVEALGISHATYARRGFFELSICIALLLPLVLVAYRSAQVHKDGRLRGLGGGLILCAIGLAVSALKRMFLYIEVYGLSVERFYAAAGIAVAISLLLWAAFCCLSPRPVSWLVSRQTVTVIFLLGLLSLVNVDGLVASSHLELVERQVRPLDDGYLSSLGCDALPVIADYKKNLPPKYEERIINIGKAIKGRSDKAEGLSFNISRYQR